MCATKHAHNDVVVLSEACSVITFHRTNRPNHTLPQTLNRKLNQLNLFSRREPNVREKSEVLQVVPWNSPCYTNIFAWELFLTGREVDCTRGAIQPGSMMFH